MSPLSLDPPSALDYFASLVAEDQGFALLEAAIAVGQDDDPALDPQSVIDEIDGLAARLNRRIPPDASGLQRLRLLNHYFFGELGFAGNVNDYHDRRNSCLHHVLRMRRGIPITLALLYIELAAQAGLQAHGISFPMHFLVKLHMRQGEVVLDPFNGQTLTREDLEERLAPYRRRLGLEGDFEVPLGLFLQTATPRETLARLLFNLKEVHRTAEDWTRLLAVQRRLVLVLPEATQELRDLGLVKAELGQLAEAAADLEAYLDREPDADDRPALAERIAELRRGGAAPRSP